MGTKRSNSPILPDMAPLQPPAQAEHAASTARAGVFFALGAYGWWAWVTPVYFWLLREVGALELLGWRVIMGVPTLLLLLWLTGRLGEIRKALNSRRTLGILGLSAILISLNWFTFVWAVINDRLAEASLGYYMTPLVSVALGVVLLREKLTRWQQVAIGIAAIGVAVMAFALNGLPWISLVLAFSFGLYGLARKQVDAAPAPGLLIEMILVFPLMAGLLLWEHNDAGLAAIDGAAWVIALLLLGGVQTIIPLLFFTAAARRLRLTTVGLMQYIAPTGQLLLATLAFGELFTRGQLYAFILIWIAIAIYSIDSIRTARRAAAEAITSRQTS